MGAPGAWTLVNGARTDIIAGNLSLSNTYKVALVASTGNVSTASAAYSALTGELSTANGYTSGGASVTLTDTGTTSVAVFFSSNPSWTASGGSIVARWAVLYKVSGDILAFCLLDATPADVTVSSGNTLTIKSDNTASNPVYTMA
jgi:hypothetical protein